MREPTERQKTVLRCVFWAQNNGRPPTVRELCKALRIRSTNGVSDHLLALERKGLVEPRDGTQSARRRIVLTPAGLAAINMHNLRPYSLAEWDSTEDPDVGRIRATIARLEQLEGQLEPTATGAA